MPSVDVVGASAPVVTSVGRMPSTLCPASIAIAAWSRAALLVVLPVALMVPPLSVSVFAAIAMPFGAEWHCQRKVARTEFSTDDRELGRPELTPLGECGGAVELEIVS